MKRSNRRVGFSVGLAALILFAGSAGAAGPLPSWHDGPAKKAIAGFVKRVTTRGGKDYVPAPERIATSASW